MEAADPSPVLPVSHTGLPSFRVVVYLQLTSPGRCEVDVHSYAPDGSFRGTVEAVEPSLGTLSFRVVTCLQLTSSDRCEIDDHS